MGPKMTMNARTFTLENAERNEKNKKKAEIEAGSPYLCCILANKLMFSTLSFVYSS